MAYKYRVYFQHKDEEGFVEVSHFHETKEPEVIEIIADHVNFSPDADLWYTGGEVPMISEIIYKQFKPLVKILKTETIQGG